MPINRRVPHAITNLDLETKTGYCQAHGEVVHVYTFRGRNGQWAARCSLAYLAWRRSTAQVRFLRKVEEVVTDILADSDAPLTPVQRDRLAEYFDRLAEDSEEAGA